MEIPGYRIERLIGEGGMASVYLAVQKSLNRHVALKLLKKFDTPEQSERFLNEGRIIASLNHRNIITIHDIGIIGEQHYISMEYLEGGDLESRIKQGMEPQAVLDLLKKIGDCLDFVHGKGIVHRDIKPANILFHKDGTPILTDFGIAKQLQQDIKLTVDGTTMGSPYYLSPEQAECRSLDGRTDIYGLGIVFFEALTGIKPYQGNSYIETVVSHLKDPIPMLQPPFQEYQELLERMIAKNPDGRFDSASEMVGFIQDMQATTPLKRLTRKVSDLVDGMHGPISVDTDATRTKQINQAIPAVGKLGTFIEKRDKVFAVLHKKSVIGPLEHKYRSLVTGIAILLLSVSIWMLMALGDSESKIEAYLLKAETAMESGNLTTPETDNAYYYYQEVLKLSPDNVVATQGVAEIVNHYAEQAETALQQLNYDKASYYAQEGLSIQPENPRLESLRERANVNKSIRQKAKKVKDYTKNVFSNLKSVFQ